MNQPTQSDPTTDVDPGDCCPECGEPGRFDLGFPDRPQCMNRSCEIEFFRIPWKAPAQEVRA